MSDTTDTLTGPAGQDAEPAAPAAGPAETPAAPAADARPRRRAAGLAGMLLPELQSMATSLGISGVGRMRKGDLVSAIQARQSGNGAPAAEGQAQLPLGGGTAPAAPAVSEPPAPVVSAPVASAPVAEPAAPVTEPTAPAAPVADAATAPAPVSDVPAEARPVLTGQPDAAVATGESGVSTDTAAPPARREGRQRRSASRPAGSPDATAAAPETVTEPVAGAERPVDGQDAGTRPERTDRGDRSDRGDRGDRGEQRRDRGQRDGGQRDGGQRDGGQRDGGQRDGGQRDGGQRDGGQRDGGQRDNQRDGERQRDDRRDSERQRDERPRDGERQRDERRDGERQGGERARDDRRDERLGGERSRDGERQRDDRPRDDRPRDGDRQRDDRPRDGDRDNQRAAAQGDRPGQRDGQRDGQGAPRDDDDDFDGRGGSRRRGRFRDRNRRNRTDRFGAGEPAEPVIAEDDVLLPVAGILDILDNYAFVRTSGYLTGPNDVYVSLAQVRRHGLRRGDAITGAVRQPREGERRDKYNALVRLDTVNGVDPEQARNRPEFMKLTPLYPQDRLRLETEPHLLTSRVIDLVMPIGKGQRALIVSPPKAGKTMILQTIANAVTTNNPECHLMVVLVDERPEEVTDMQRAVKGEVIASTFDRPPTDHTTVAELSIERAKRLVELGHDVVVLLDNITRLGRAYNLAAPASGRILSGGVDSTALYPPKRFLGAARNIEHGGSLTILATALIETGSTMDTVIFEEFKGTGNAELILSRKIANKRTFPAVDVIASGTRKEEILLAPEELVIVHKLRRVLNALDPEQAIDLLLDRLKQSRTNVEFLMQIAKSTPGQD